MASWRQLDWSERDLKKLPGGSKLRSLHGVHVFPARLDANLKAAQLQRKLFQPVWTEVSEPISEKTARPPSACAYDSQGAPRALALQCLNPRCSVKTAMRTSSGHWRFFSISNPRKRHALLFTCRKGLIFIFQARAPFARSWPCTSRSSAATCMVHLVWADVHDRTTTRLYCGPGRRQDRGQDFISNSRLRNFSFFLRIQVPAGAARAGPSHLPRAPTQGGEARAAGAREPGAGEGPACGGGERA